VRPGSHTISDKWGHTVDVDAKPGNTYFLRLSPNLRKRVLSKGVVAYGLADIKLVDSVQGELESSIVKNKILIK
jgi:hypothetical protein